MYKIQAYSVKGKKNKQEDDYLIIENKNEWLVLVADGVGGHGNGDFASRETIRIFQQAFSVYNRSQDPFDFLKQNALKAAQAVLDKAINQPEFKNCGTTLSGFLLKDDKAYVINIGDSRTYHFTANTLTALTKDQSLMRRMIENGEITPEEAKNHPKRKIMTSAIGQKIEMIQIDLEGPFLLSTKGILLATSDGVHDFFEHYQLEQFIAENQHDENLSKLLVEKALENQSDDNITACILLYDKNKL